MSSITLRQVWDQNDDQNLRETIIKVSQRLHHFSEGAIHEIVVNCVSMLLIRTMIDGMIEQISEQEGIDLAALPQIVGTGYNLTIVTRKQN